MRVVAVIGLLIALTLLGTASAQDTPAVITPANAAELTVIAALGGHADRVTALAFSPDGTALVTASNDTSVRVWSAGDFALRGEYFEHGSFIKGLAFNMASPGQFATASWDGSALVWALTPQGAVVTRRLAGYSAVVERVSFSPDGETVAFSVGDGTVRQVALLTGQEWREPLAVGALAVNAAAYRPAQAEPGRALLVTAGGFPERVARVWNPATGEEIAVLDGHDAPVTALAFSADGSQLAVGAADGSLALWALNDDLIEATALVTLDDWVSALAISPAGDLLVAALQDGAVVMLSLPELDTLTMLPGVGSVAWALSFAPDGEQVAAGYDDGTVRVWGVVP